MNNFEPIIGLEIHVELKTKSKMFCGCNADYFGHEPNTHCCPVCLGLPGALPVPNRRAVEWCVMLGLALNCEIPLLSKFDRKNYFYPDLPKGYQISQYDKPFCVNGWMEIYIKDVISNEVRNPGSIAAVKNIRFARSLANARDDNGSKKTIRIRRVHMEEDTGKLLHGVVNGEKCTLIDFNRSSVPLVEIVTEPDIRSSDEAKIFLKKLYQIIRYLGISDADMVKGSMRLEPNISVGIAASPSAPRNDNNKESELPSYKVEVKNINSFNFVKKAIDYEIERQIEILERGEIPKQETRGWDEKKGITYSQRSKEEAHDYRYFPEPDIPPIRWTTDQITKYKLQIPELPDKKLKRFIKEYGLSEYDAAILTEEKEVAEYYESGIKNYELRIKNEKVNITPKIIANWIINKKVNISRVTPEELVKLISQKQQTVQIDEKELDKIIDEILSDNQKAVNDYKAGKTQVLMFLLGMVMRGLAGKGDTALIRKLLEKRLQ
ncbi:Asp-tRNA(Asn)/Glu-tRNA(Gln) amidotransferase subunit GatB [Candidatus Microgenomates bacterium]|nr:Asp-tRNA(Asn)/Glu-tRNA(Gln) amidotransferase subunit GatB [Candidatus Microgenomates bacterium]